jgi:tetraacyldisaccharide 4'-kinase
MLALAAGAEVPSYHTGDEPQIFLRAGVAPVGIGADRYASGGELIRKFGCDTLILDDGFQQAALARDLDIVLVDALDPLAGGGVFPLGRLREPFSAIERADIVLITRSEFSDLVPAIEQEIRIWNTRAPIFRARLSPRDWVSAVSGKSFPQDAPPFRRPIAFCGLGNPQSFRRTLGLLGIVPAGWHEFEDHHRYRVRELMRLKYHLAEHKADAMVTTEKDAVNLPELPEELPIYYLRIEMAVEPEEEFLARLWNGSGS